MTDFTASHGPPAKSKSMSADSVCMFLDPGRQLPSLHLADLDKTIRRQYITEARLTVRTSFSPVTAALGESRKWALCGRPLAFAEANSGRHGKRAAVKWNPSSTYNGSQEPQEDK